MGEPAELSQADRKALLAYARDLITAVTDDLEQPTMRDQHGEAIPAETVELMLCQLVELLLVRGRRMAEVFNAGLEYANGTAPEPVRWKAYRAAAYRAAELEKKDEARDG